MTTSKKAQDKNYKELEEKQRTSRKGPREARITERTGETVPHTGAAA